MHTSRDQSLSTKYFDPKNPFVSGSFLGYPKIAGNDDGIPY